MSDRMDPKLRELTYRLIAMAPEAPPFPEDSMVQLKPTPAPSPSARRRSPLVWVGVAAVVALLVVGIPLFLFGGGDEPSPTTIPPATQTSVPDDITPTTTPPPVGATTIPFAVYLFSDELTTPGGDPVLVAVQRTVEVPPDSDAPSETELAITALRSLVQDPVPVGYSTAVPQAIDTVGTGYDVGTGVLRFDVSWGFDGGGGSVSMFARLAQVVFTATQFPEVEAVLFTDGGVPIDVFSGEGIVLDGPQTRQSYATDQRIFLDAPAIGSTVASPITISGFSNIFETVIGYEVTTAEGTVLDSGLTRTSCENGCSGDFAVESSYALGADAAGFVAVFDGSAADGSRTHIVTYPVTLLASEAVEAAGGGPSYLYAGFDALSGAGPYPGRIVAESPLSVSVGSDPDAEVSVNGAVNGAIVALDEFGGGSADIELVEGENTIVVTSSRSGQTIMETLVVRYVPDATIEFAYLTQVGANEMVADYAQWFTGDEASQAAFDDGVIGSVQEGVPNDFYIRNVNDQLRPLSLAPDAGVVLINPLEIGPITVAVEDWVALFKPDGTPWDYEVDEVPSFPEPYFDYYGANIVQTPYWLYLDADGTVIQIEQQYLP